MTEKIRKCYGEIGYEVHCNEFGGNRTEWDKQTQTLRDVWHKVAGAVIAAYKEREGCQKQIPCVSDITQEMFEATERSVSNLANNLASVRHELNIRLDIQEATRIAANKSISDRIDNIVRRSNVDMSQIVDVTENLDTVKEKLNRQAQEFALFASSVHIDIESLKKLHCIGEKNATNDHMQYGEHGTRPIADVMPKDFPQNVAAVKERLQPPFAPGDRDRVIKDAPLPNAGVLCKGSDGIVAKSTPDAASLLEDTGWFITNDHFEKAETEPGYMGSGKGICKCDHDFAPVWPKTQNTDVKFCTCLKCGFSRRVQPGDVFEVPVAKHRMQQ